MLRRIWSEATACGHYAGPQAVGGSTTGTLVSRWIIEKRHRLGNLSEVSICLPRTQRRQLKRALADRRKPDFLTDSGGVDVILFFWERHGRPDLLVMACTGTADEVEAVALQAAPRDQESLILRAGPDATVLRECRATLFGAGALGGHTATLLAESGIGFCGYRRS